MLIFVEQKGQGDQALDTSKAQVLDRAERHLRRRRIPASRTSTPPRLLRSLMSLTASDPLGLSTNAGDRYQQLARKILAYRDTTKNGVLTNFDDLSAV